MVQSTSLWSFSTSSAPASTALAATTPTVTDFAAWSASAQAAYVRANSMDDPPFVVIGDPGEPQILATLSLDRRSVVSSAVPASYSEALSTGDLPTSDDFAKWDPELQLAYLRNEGIDASSSLVLGDKGGAQLVATLNWNGTGVVTTPVPTSYDVATGAVPATPPASTALRAADFQSWPEVLQLAYLKANGTGTPPFLIVGDPRDTQILATSSADGRSVVTSTVPQSYAAAVLTGVAPAGSSALSWAPQLQLSYLQTIEAGLSKSDVPAFLVIGDPSGTQTLATLGPDGKSVVTSAAPRSYSTAMSTGALPAAVDAEAWPAALQLSYLQSGSTDVPPLLITGDPSGTQTLVSLGADRESLVTASVPASYSTAVSTGAAPTSDDFARWDPKLQLAYLRSHGAGAPPSLVLQPKAAGPNDTGSLVTLGADGRSAVVAALPQSYVSAASAYTGPVPPLVTLAVFQAYTQQQQLAYLDRNGSGQPPSLVLDAGSADAVLVTRSATVPQAVVFTPMLGILQGWAPQLALAFVGRFGTVQKTPGGTQTSMTFGSGQQAYTASVTAGGTAVTVVKGDAGSPSYWGTTTAAPSAAAIQAQAQAVTSDLFSSWPLASQVAYLQANGSGSPTGLLLPTADGTGQVLISLAPGSNVVQGTPVPQDALANLSSQPTTAASTLAVFDGWTTAAQQAYLDGRADTVTLAQFDALSTADQTAYLAAVPDTATLTAFQSWPAEIQAYYVANKGVGSPPSLTLSDGHGGVVATLSSDGTSVQFTATSTRAALDAATVAQTTAITPTAFFNLTPDEQATYYQNCYSAKIKAISSPPYQLPAGATSPNILDLTGAATGGTTIANIAVAGQTIQVALPLSAGYGDFKTGTADGATFETWPPQVQAAYVGQYGQPATGAYPKIVVLTDGGTVATISTAGAEADVVSVPGLSGAIAGGAASVTPQAFLTWPYAGQLAFMQKQAGSVTLGTPPNEVTVTPTPDKSGFALAMADVPKSASGIDFSLWSKVASPLLQAQLLATLGTLSGVLAYDTAPPPVIVTTATVAPYAGKTIIVSAGTAATGGGLTIELQPSDFTAAPASLTPSAFMAWSPAVRQAYVQAHVEPDALPGTLDQNKKTVPPFVVGTGVTALSITFSGTDGTLQIGVPQTLADVAASGTGMSAAATALAGTLLPYNYLPGSAVGTSSAINDAVAGALYPVLDGSGGAHDVAMTAQQASDFAKAPTDLSGATFAGWPSALQLQYLRSYQQDGEPLTIGTGADSLDVLMQTTAQAGAVPKVYIVQNLQKADIGSMSFADQATLAKSAAFQTLASGLGLIPDCATAAAMTSGTTAPLTGSVGTVNGVTVGGDIPDPNAGLAPDAVTGLGGAATAAELSSAGATLSAFGFVQQMFVTALNTIDHPTQVAPAPGLPDGNMPAGDRQVFEDEVDLLRRQTFGSPVPASQAAQSSGLAVFSPKDIQDKLTAIIQRFTRANAFSSIANAPDANSGYFQIMGIDGMASDDPGVNQWIYNPNGAADQTVEQFLTYYTVGDNDYRATQTSTDAFKSEIVNAFETAGLPAAGTSAGTPFTLSNISIDLTSLDYENQTNGVSAAGDSAIVNAITLQRLPDDYTSGTASSQGGSILPGASPSASENVIQLSDGHYYEILGLSGTAVNAASNTPTSFFAHAYSWNGDRNKDYTSSLSGFSSAYNIMDDGAGILAGAKANITAAGINYKDGAYHTISIPASGGASTVSGNGRTFTMTSVTVRYVPAAASTDNNATIDSGYSTFMAQEKSIFDLANRADQLANSGKIGGTQQNLDVPNMIYLFMMYTNLTGEATLRADTEEVNQTNAVLNEYAAMQKIINQTVAAIKPGDDGKAGYGALTGSNPDGSFTTQDQGALAMFTRGNSTAGTGNAVSQNPPLSPIELLQSGFSRPYLSNGVGAFVTSSQWSSDGTSLSDAVTQLNQASQLKMNDINSETKQKDREFDLANTALQQAQTVLNQIASTTSG